MYLTGLDGTTTHELCQESSLGNFHFQNISNGLVDFAYVVEGYDTNDKLAIAWFILCIFGVAVHWSYKTQPSSAAHSIDSEVWTF